MSCRFCHEFKLEHPFSLFFVLSAALGLPGCSQSGTMLSHFGQKEAASGNVSPDQPGGTGDDPSPGDQSLPLEPHSPAGYEPLVNRAFSSKAVSSTSGRGTGAYPDKKEGSEGWDDIEYRMDSVTLQADPTAPHSADGVFKWTFPAGFEGGSSPGVAQTLGLGSDLQALFVSTAFKVSDNWDGHPTGVNKLWFMRGSGLYPDPFALLKGSGRDGELQLAVNLQGAVESDRGNLLANTGAAALTDVDHVKRGKWYRVDVELMLNTPGQPNGVLRVWFADPATDSKMTLTHEYTDIRWTDRPSSWEYVQISPIWGGLGGALAQEQSLYFDFMNISGKR
jgi:hypothetical protein